MTKFWKYVWAGALMVAMTAYAGTMTTLQGQGQPAQDQIFEGRLLKIDLDAKVLTVEGTDKKSMEFTFTDRTQVTGADKSVQGLAGKSGAGLRVHYRPAGAANGATRIEVLSN
jgi:hypothetical protein